MKKVVFIIVLILLITGCKNNNYYINTIIEKKNNCLIAINYPVTNIKKLDKKINKYIDSKYDCLTDNINELNIDYTFNIISDRYINITLETFINDGNNNYDIVTYIFDKKINKFLNLDNLVSKNSLITIKQITEKKLDESVNINYDKLTFDENYLYFYLENNDGIEKVNVPLHDTEVLIDIDLSTSENKTTNQTAEPKIIDPNKPVVAITFDDGPSKYTDDILDILNENNASATFFVLGNKVKYYGNTLNKMLQNGNEIGNHSYNHKSLNHLNMDELLYQINTTQDIIYEATGYTPIYLRPTYGNTNDFLKKNSHLEIVLWTVDPEDWKYKNSKTIASRVINKTKDGSIILLHDTKKRTVEALKIIISDLKKKDYQFVTISELKEVKEIRQKMGIG